MFVMWEIIMTWKISIFPCRYINTADPKDNYKIKKYRFLVKKLTTTWSDNFQEPAWEFMAQLFFVHISIMWDR